MRETDTSHEILPARIGPQVVKHRKRQLDDSENPLLIGLLQQLECGSQVTESGVNDGNIKWGDVLLVGQRLQLIEDTFRLRPFTCQCIGAAQQRPARRSAAKAECLFEFFDRFCKLALLLQGK
jgi:hypothetical protein